jgi:hypothetical protein
VKTNAKEIGAAWTAAGESWGESFARAALNDEQLTVMRAGGDPFAKVPKGTRLPSSGAPAEQGSQGTGSATAKP